MKISARNVLGGTVARLTSGAVNSEVVLSLNGGGQITATINNAGAKSLGLAVGKPATALIKAYSVMVMLPEGEYGLSARNALRGKVTGIANASVSSDIAIALEGGDEVHAAVPRDSVTSLGLEPGTEVIAVIKASSVIISVPT